MKTMRDIIDALDAIMEVSVSSKERTYETIKYDDVVWEIYALFDDIHNISNNFKTPVMIAYSPDDRYNLENKAEALFSYVVKNHPPSQQVYRLMTILKEYIIDEKYDFKD